MKMSGNLQHTVSINVANHNRSCHSQLLTFETSCKHARARMRCSPFANGMLCRSPKPTKTTQNINNFGYKNLPCQEYSCEKVFFIFVGKVTTSLLLYPWKVGAFLMRVRYSWRYPLTAQQSTVAIETTSYTCAVLPLSPRSTPRAS